MEISIFNSELPGQLLLRYPVCSEITHSNPEEEIWSDEYVSNEDNMILKGSQETSQTAVSGTPHHFRSRDLRESG